MSLEGFRWPDHFSLFGSQKPPCKCRPSGCQWSMAAGKFYCQVQDKNCLAANGVFGTKWTLCGQGIDDSNHVYWGRPSRAEIYATDSKAICQSHEVGRSHWSRIGSSLVDLARSEKLATRTVLNRTGSASGIPNRSALQGICSKSRNTISSWPAPNWRALQGICSKSKNTMSSRSAPTRRALQWICSKSRNTVNILKCYIRW